MSKLKILLINANSLIALSRRHFLDSLLNDKKPDIVLVSETKLKPRFKLSFRNYKVVRSDRIDSPGGGCAIIIKENIKFEISKIENINILEYCSIIITNSINHKKLRICSIYNKKGEQDISADLSTIFSASQNTDIIVGGDFNARNTAWGDTAVNKSGKVVKEWLDKYDARFNVSHIPTLHPTRENSFLDFFIINNSLNIEYSNNHPLYLKTFPYDSDHMGVELIITNQKMTQTTPVLRFDYTNTDVMKFRRHIDTLMQQNHLDTNRNLTNDEIVNATYRYNTIMKKAIDVAVPVITVKERGLIKLNDITIKLIAMKKQLRKALYRNGDTTLKPFIKHLDVLIKEQIKITHDEYWQKRFSSIKVDRDTFKNVKNLAGIKRTYDIPILVVNGVLLNDTKEKVDVLASNFASIHRQNNNMGDPHFTSTVEDCARQFSIPLPLFQFNEQMNSLKTSIPPQLHTTYEQFMDLNDLNSILKSRNNKKSAGNDIVPMYLLKKIPDSLKKYLVVLFNNIYNNSFIPPSWKESYVMPIVKPFKNPQSPDSYRPISLLPNVSKVYEEFIYKKVLTHIDTNDIYRPFQFGFRKSHSTNHALCIFTSDITSQLNKRIGTIAASLDTEKAFDTAWRKGIIYKMKNTYYFTDHLCSVIHNYLQDRTFKVKSGEIISNMESADEGVPQGSILGPVLFNLFTMDIPSPSNDDTKILAYADDILIYSSSSRLCRANKNVNEYLKIYKKFTDKWKLRVNANKCEVIKFHNQFSYPNAKKYKQSICFGDFQIKNVETLKYLGLNISYNLRYNKHIKIILNKCKAALSLYFKLLSNFNLSKKIKLIIYKQIFRPALGYAFPSWFNISPNLMENLRRFERKCLRHCTGLYMRSNQKYYRNFIVYKEAKIIRIDNFFIKLCEQFVNNLSTIDNELILKLNRNNNISLNDNLYDVRHLKKLIFENKFLNERNEIHYYNGSHDSAQFVS